MMSSSVRGRVVILAGGKGKRLAPYTFVIPKPIVPIGTTPILEVVLRQLAGFGFRQVTIALGHMSEIIRAVAGDGSRFGVDIAYSQETKPLGTIGPLTLVDDLTEDFIVMNADLLTDLNFAELWDYHRRHQGIATIATYVKATKLELGVLQTDDNDRLVGFEEKPTLQHKVSMGIYVFNRRALEFVPRDTYFGFDTLMLRLLERGETVRTFPFAGRWLDIGVPADYEKAQEEFETRREAYLGAPGDPSA
jgi:NDP-sugar pyrophosphorylase family protein